MKALLTVTALAWAAGSSASAVLDRAPFFFPHSGPEAGIFANAQPHHQDAEPVFAGRIPTTAESAVLARRVLALTPFGTAVSAFPHDQDGSAPTTLENRPAGLGGFPIGMPEYIADCEGDSGNPTLLAVTISTTFRNAHAGSNVSLTLQWDLPHRGGSPPPDSTGAQRLSLSSGLRFFQSWLLGRDTVPARTGTAGSTVTTAPSPASLPRFSLLGYFEPITGQDLPTSDVASCFTKSHPDARWWLPGNPIHKTEWVRLVVTQVYWLGGFGDRAYIGWIPVEEWRNVTRADWEKVRLPGEDNNGYSWTVSSVDL